MSRYIDADKLKQRYSWWDRTGDYEAYKAKKLFDDIIDLQPTADVRENVQLDVCPLYGGACGYPSGECYDCPRHGNFRENVRGEWIRRDSRYVGWISFDCSVCGETLELDRETSNDFKYCPFCGADMRGDKS